MSGARDTVEGREAVLVRHCDGLAEYEACLELERIVWGSGDVDVVPTSIFVVVKETGGQVLGAFDSQAGGRMIGFTLAMAAFHGEQRYLHSHMTAVLPEYQNRGVGRMLKLLQRRDALERGIRLVEWTFDPLEVRNAYFNIERLGAEVTRLLPNVYGITSSPLHSGMPTDRLVAEWRLDSPRVLARVEGQGSALAAPGPAAERIAVPRDIAEIKARDREAAIRIQSSVREQFEKWLARGYRVTRFEPGPGSGPASYVLEPYET
jgi:predicted GNAT superfamily acetyltransferase